MQERNPFGQPARRILIQSLERLKWSKFVTYRIQQELLLSKFEHGWWSLYDLIQPWTSSPLRSHRSCGRIAPHLHWFPANRRLPATRKGCSHSTDTSSFGTMVDIVQDWLNTWTNKLLHGFNLYNKLFEWNQIIYWLHATTEIKD